MKPLERVLFAACILLVAEAAFGNEACEKCTRDVQAQYAKCLQSGKDQVTCNKEQQAAAQACANICKPK
jgi:homoserine dehydrogenase